MAEHTIAAIYTGAALVKPLSDLMKETLGDYKVMNILDDSMIADIIEAGGMTKAVKRRLYGYYEIACASGAELILNTCSSIGDAVYGARDFFPIPIIRIDEPMARRAIELTDSIAVLATLPTTLDPTIRLLQRCAQEAGKSIRTISALAEGAFPAITAGDAETHDRLIAETAKRVADSCDVILLAQGSMARMEKPLADLTGKTVLSSPRLGVEQIKGLL
ncbi:aspartate/glutamate racemase family protein [uncultured Sphaerochaeta sp.]|uniref:aspartate/glutamate racemase family protein n=1 Tax=uncultured Sphaerochaeta sp. TaxID=886478 RepID=UPI002A0A1E97|nr:aspartate/glutamate racemase family protein [uncultured Sphaerochaeta sp.]